MKRQVTALLLTASLLVQSMAWAEQLGTPSDLPTESPAPTAAATTEAPPSETATPAPSETAAAAPTETPTEAPTEEPTVPPTATPTQAPASGEGYYVLDGVRQYGDLQTLLPLAQQAGKTIYITETRVIALAGWSAAGVQRVKLLPDSTVFPEQKWNVYVSETNPNGASAANTVYVWVAKSSSVPTAAPTEVPTEAPTEAPTVEPTMTPQPEDTPQPDGPGGEDNDRPGGGGQPSGGGKPSGGMPSGNGQGAAPTAATDLTVATTHVKSDTTAVVAYDGVELTVTAEPMLTLEIGGETLPLTLANTNGEAAAFTAALTALKENDGTADTLLLTAVDAEAVTWRFTGEVSKTLAASGAAYLTLQVGQQALVLPTEKLLGGLRYAMYREKGLGSSAFLYEVQMDAAGSVVFRVTVGSDVWEISQDDTALLYYREIYNGPADVLAREQ